MSERAVLPPRAWIAPDRRLCILVWPVHATWMSAFVAGRAPTTVIEHRVADLVPVVVLAATEAIEAVPSDAGVASTRVDVLADAARELINAPDLAAELGKQARQAAPSRYGLEAFLRDWDWLLAETVGPG